MANLYEKSHVIMPDRSEIPIQRLIDTVTLAALTPEKLQWVMLMVRAQLLSDHCENELKITPGLEDYILRQIIYYGIDAMMGDQ